MRPLHWFAASLVALLSSPLSWASQNVLLTEVPDYTWYAGCFGTASGNLMGYWDRHGFDDMYTGPTAGGVAPLDSDGSNIGIRSMWASRAGLDGRPAGQFGHIDDYWDYYNDDISFSYESTDPDPYLRAGRPEHTPDCIGDFIGLSQNKWTNLNNECSGNIDAFSFVFWDESGAKRVNYVPHSAGGQVIPDIPSGLRNWTRYRGYVADTFSQLTDFNPSAAPGQGFGFADLQAEIDAGYPVLLYLQQYNQLYRNLPGMDHANPDMHGMLAYGYYVADNGNQYVRYKDSWGGSGDLRLALWGPQDWEAQLPVRGVIAYHPLPKITSVRQSNQQVIIQWDGPTSVLSNLVTQTSVPLHQYVVEKATSLAPANFEAASSPTTDRSVTLPDCCGEEAVFYRVKLLPAPTEQAQNN